MIRTRLPAGCLRRTLPSADAAFEVLRGVAGARSMRPFFQTGTCPKNPARGPLHCTTVKSRNQTSCSAREFEMSVSESNSRSSIRQPCARAHSSTRSCSVRFRLRILSTASVCALASARKSAAPARFSAWRRGAILARDHWRQIRLRLFFTREASQQAGAGAVQRTPWVFASLCGPCGTSELHEKTLVVVGEAAEVARTAQPPLRAALVRAARRRAHARSRARSSSAIWIS